jgi:hypothetical protein
LAYSVNDGGKNEEMMAAWDRSRERIIPLGNYASRTLVDSTGQKIYIPRTELGSFSLAELYLWDTEDRKNFNITLETTLECELGGPLILSIAVQELVRKGHLSLRGSILADVPLWEPECGVHPEDRMVLGEIPIPARVVTLPEEGWKGRTLSIPPWAYALLSACARHWFQANLLAAEPRVGVGFEAAYKLWDSVKNLGRFPTGWLKYPHVSGDVSQCTDSTSLVVHLALLQAYLGRMQEKGVTIPTCVWASVSLLCSSHIFTYPGDGGGVYTVEGDHVTGVMMGEGLSFIAMLLQNLTLDEYVSTIEREMAIPGTELPIVARPEGLTDIVGDDYLRKFCTQPRLYSQTAWEWYSWRMSKGKNGVSYTCLQLAEEWGYARPFDYLTESELKAPYGRHISKQDVIKIKYFAVPGSASSKDTPAWVGRCRPLSQHMDWCPDIRKDYKALLCDAFRRSYRDIPRDIPLAWTLPGVLGGIHYPTTRTVHCILRKMKLDRKICILLGLPSWELQATLQRLAAYHQPYGTNKGVVIPRFRDLDLMLGGFARTPSAEFSHRPVLTDSVQRFLISNPSELAPRMGWRWSASLGTLAPSLEQVDAYMRTLDYVPVSQIDSHALRRETLRLLVTGQTRERSDLAPRHGRSAASILARILEGVNRRNPLTAEGWEFVKEKWATIYSPAKTPMELANKLAYVQGFAYVKRDSAYAAFFVETYPWSFNLYR